MLNAPYFLPLTDYRYSKIKHGTMIPIQTEFLQRHNVLLHASSFGYSPMRYNAKETTVIDTHNTFTSTFGNVAMPHSSSEPFEILKRTQSYEDTLSPLSTASAPATSFSSASSQQSKKLFSCLQCSYSTDRKNNLKRHVITMHLECSRKLDCCGIQFRSKATIREHVNSCHKNGYCCRTCGRVFCRKALLRRHWTVHSGVKEFHCASCNYATSHKSNLERHQRVHCRESTDNVCDCKKASTDQNLFDSQNTDTEGQCKDTFKSINTVSNGNVDNDSNNNNTRVLYCDTSNDSFDLKDRGRTRTVQHYETEIANDYRLLYNEHLKNKDTCESLETTCGNIDLNGNKNVLINDMKNRDGNRNSIQNIGHLNYKETNSKYEIVSSPIINVDGTYVASNVLCDKLSDLLDKTFTENVDISTKISLNEILGNRVKAGVIKTDKANTGGIVTAMQPEPDYENDDGNARYANVTATKHLETKSEETIHTNHFIIKSTEKNTSRNIGRLCQRPYLCGRCGHRFQTQLIHEHHNRSECTSTSEQMEYAVSIVAKTLKSGTTVP